MAGVERANHDSGIPRILPLLLWVGNGGRDARGQRGGKSEEVGHAMSGAPMTR